MSYLKKILYFLGFVFSIFSYGNYRGRKSEKSKNDSMILEEIYDAKTRQDEYDIVPIADKRKWLQQYSKKVPVLAKTATKK